MMNNPVQIELLTVIVNIGVGRKVIRLPRKRHFRWYCLLGKYRKQPILKF